MLVRVPQQLARAAATRACIGGCWAQAAREVGICAEQEVDAVQLKELVHSLEQQTIQADSKAYCDILKLCGKLKALPEGREVHAHIVRHGIQSDVFLGSCLLSMYGRCGSLDDARRIFERLHWRNEFTWTTMITAYAQDGHFGQALLFFQRMQQEGVRPSSGTFLNLLKTIPSSPETLAQGKLIHDSVVASGCESNVFIGTCLVNMYTKCDRLDDAEKLFHKMVERNVVSWNSMIGAYTQHGCCNKAIQLFQRMQLDGTKPSVVTFVSVVDACAGMGNLAEGNLVHNLCLESGFISDPFVGNAIVSMYGDSGCLEDACRVFHQMPQRNIVSWTAMISAFLQHGHEREGIHAFRQMQQEGVMPDKVTFFTVVNACANIAALAEGKEIHDCVCACGLESDPLVGSALVNMYGKCHSLGRAHVVLRKVNHGVAWNTMIAAYSQNGRDEDALKVFKEMQLEGMNRNNFTFASIINACTNLGQLVESRMIHACIAESGLESDSYVGTALLDMYGKCGSLEDARRMFDKLCRLDEVAWNAMMTANMQHGEYEEALRLFCHMQLEGVAADKITIITVLNVFNSLTDLEGCKLIHARVVESRLLMDSVIGSALVSMYGKHGNLTVARRVFNEMEDQTSALWNAMIGSYAQNGFCTKALRLCQQMQLEGVKPDRVTFITALDACQSPEALQAGKMIHACVAESGAWSDVSVGNALMNMYGNCGSFDDVKSVMEKMVQKDVISWTATIAAYTQNKLGKEAVVQYKFMLLDGIKPTNVTFVTMLEACTDIMDAREAKSMHGHILERGMESDAIVANALVSMYGKCGSLEEALTMFGKRTKWDVIGWSALVAAYARHGCGEEAVRRFWTMQQEGVYPNEVTFVTVLSASSHAGLLETGCYSFGSMQEDFGIMRVPEHYGCVIDLLSRAGQLEEAERFVKRMPIRPDAVAWMTLLGACKNHGDVERGKNAAENAVKLVPRYSAPYVILSNMYAGSGKKKGQEKKCMLLDLT